MKHSNALPLVALEQCAGCIATSQNAAVCVNSHGMGGKGERQHPSPAYYQKERKLPATPQCAFLLNCIHVTPKPLQITMTSKETIFVCLLVLGKHS